MKSTQNSKSTGEKGQKDEKIQRVSKQSGGTIKEKRFLGQSSSDEAVGPKKQKLHYSGAVAEQFRGLTGLIEKIRNSSGHRE